MAITCHRRAFAWAVECPVLSGEFFLRRQNRVPASLMVLGQCCSSFLSSVARLMNSTISNSSTGMRTAPSPVGKEARQRLLTKRRNCRAQALANVSTPHTCIGCSRDQPCVSTCRATRGVEADRTATSYVGHGASACSLASPNTVSVIQRLKPSLSMNCLNNWLSSFIIEVITRSKALSCSMRAFSRSEFI